MTSLAMLVDQVLASVPGGSARLRPPPGPRAGRGRPGTGPGAVPLAHPRGAARSRGCAGTGSRSFPRGCGPCTRSGRSARAGPADGAWPARPAARADCAAVPPAGDGQRLVVTVHDLAFLVHPDAFPRRWALAVPRGPVARRAKRRRVDRGVAPHRRGPDAPHAGEAGEGVRDAARPGAARDGRGRLRGAGAAPDLIAVHPVGGNARAAEEPDASGPRVPAPGRARRPALAGPGGAGRWRPGELLEETTKEGPGYDRAHGLRVGERPRRAVPGRRHVRLPVAVRGLRAAGAGRDGRAACRRWCRRRRRCPRWPARRRSRSTRGRSRASPTRSSR